MHHRFSLTIYTVPLLLFMLFGSPALIKATAQSERGLVAYWPGNGNAIDAVGGNNGTLHDGAGFGAAQNGTKGFDMNGDDRAGVSVPDSEPLRFTKSFTITAWVLMRGRPAGPPRDWGMIVFRGDNRPGLDPYQLAIDPEGNMVFQIMDAANMYARIRAPMPVGKFMFVQATMNDAASDMDLYLNGIHVAHDHHALRPMHDLDAGADPGIGIGNVGGNSHTFHFAFDGVISQVKLYNIAVPVIVPSSGETYTLQRKFKQGEVKRFQVRAMSGDMAFGASLSAADVDVVITATTRNTGADGSLTIDYTCSNAAVVDSGVRAEIKRMPQLTLTRTAAGLVQVVIARMEAGPGFIKLSDALQYTAACDVSHRAFIPVALGDSWKVDDTPVWSELLPKVPALCQFEAIEQMGAAEVACVSSRAYVAGSINKEPINSHLVVKLYIDIHTGGLVYGQMTRSDGDGKGGHGIAVTIVQLPPTASH